MVDDARDALLAVTAGLALSPSSLDAIRARAPGVVVRGETFDRSGSPVAGGLADPLLFGESGDRFARIVLVEPSPHPLIGGGEIRIQELPVLPPVHRPPAPPPPLRSSLELLYVTVLHRNHRLASALRLGAPEPLLRQERDQLARAILQLFANRRSPNPQLDMHDEPHAGLLDLASQGDPRTVRAILFALALETS